MNYRVDYGMFACKDILFYVDDLAGAVVHLQNIPQERSASETEPMRSHINAGTGTDVTIRELAGTLVELIGYEGKLVFNTTKPDGTKRELMDVSRLKHLAWMSKIALRKGLAKTYEWYQEHHEIGQRA